MNIATSLLSFPDRGPWGDARFPGNCSGYVIGALLDHLHPMDLLVDPMEGSGTSRVVAAERGVAYVGLDLRDGFDLVRMPLLPRLPRPADLVFVHPPYWNIIPYSGAVWGEKPDPRDLSRVPDYDDYLQLLRQALQNAALAVRPGGHFAVLVGDIRRRGRYYSPQACICNWTELGDLQAIWIKAQHHMRSNGRHYGRPLVRIAHEYLLLFRRTPSSDNAGACGK